MAKQLTMADIERFVQAFSFFLNYSELSDGDLQQSWEAKNKQYSRYEYVKVYSDADRIPINQAKNESIFSKEWITLVIDRDNDIFEDLVEVIITGDWSLEEHNNDYHTLLKEDIVKNKNIVIYCLNAFYKDLKLSTKREIFLKTVKQIKGLKEIYNSAKFINNGLLTESLKEIFKSVKPFAQLYPDIARSNDFVGLEVYFEGIDKRLKLKVTPQKAKAVLKCLTETPDNWDGPLITETDLEYFLSKNFQGFDMVHEDKIIRLNVGEKYKGLVWSIFHWFYSHCTSNVTKETFVIIILNSFPNTFTGKAANYIKNMKKDSELNEKLRKIGITSYPAL